ncbi:MAG TPA: CHAT domain-containing tetratricopeptide repeat protein [Pyrinomonadaceae bacterium]
MFTARRIHAPCIVYLAVVMAAGGLAAPSRASLPGAQADVPLPAVGEPLRSEMAGGETQLFRVALSAGQYLRVVVEQRGIDVAVALVGPGQKRLLEMDSPNGSYGPEPVSALVEESGEYTIEVRSPDKKAAAGLFELRVEALREPSPADRTRAGAEQTFREASRQFTQPDAKSRQEALEKLEALLPVFRSLEDRPMEVSTLNRLGLAYNSLGHPQRALAHYEQALAVSRALGDGRNEARMLNNIGGAYDLLGEPQRALDNYGRALALWEQQGNSAAQSDALNNIGVSYYNLGELQRSLDYYNRALPLRRAAGNPRREADTLDNVGVVYIALGEPRRALEYLTQALELRRAAKDVSGEANSLSQIGFAHAALGETTKALDYYNEALPLRRAAGDRRGEGIALRNIGVAYASLGQPQKAVEEHEQALKLFRAIGSRRDEASALLYLGQAHTLSGEVQKGAEYYAQALSLFQTLNDRVSEAKTRQSLAEAESARGNLAQAREQIEAAISIIEAMRAQVVSRQLRTSFFASRQGAYEFEIDLLMRMHRLDPTKGHDAAALGVSERARARGLLEMLSESGVDVRQGVEPALLGRERELSQRLSAKAARLIALLGQQNRQEQAAALKKEVEALEEEHQQVLGEIRRRSPHYAAVTQPRPLGLREIQKLLDPDTLLLEYSLGAERSYLWAVSRDGLRSFQLPGRERVEQTARRLYELVTARGVRNRGESAQERQERIGRADSQTHEAADELSRVVLGPAASELSGKRLVVVADGALQYIPFAMLPVPNGGTRGVVNYRPLIVEHEVVSLPSASTLAVQRAELAGRGPAPNNIALIADPVFDGGDARVASKMKRERGPATDKVEDASATRTLEHLAPGAPRIPRLPYTRQEAERILAVAPKASNLRALDFKASLATALGGELRKYRYIHLATHGYIDSERPALSAVVLSLVNERGEPQDGLLKSQEIYNLDLPAELVVLSACRTGLGREVKGEGLVGLTRGFMYAGAARVVVSLWNVSDKGTAVLMSRLYEGMLRDGLRPTAALRAAQLELWRQKQWQSPFYWAAFVQQGEWR